MTAIALLVFGAGLVLMFAAYRNLSPIDVVYRALGQRDEVRPLGQGGPQ